MEKKKVAQHDTITLGTHSPPVHSDSRSVYGGWGGHMLDHSNFCVDAGENIKKKRQARKQKSKGYGGGGGGDGDGETTEQI